MTTRLRWGSATDVGLVRRNNEDSVLVAAPLFAVADGMGGHAAGEVASQLTVEALATGFRREPTATGLVEAVRTANVVVWERAQADSSVRGMGTTVTAAALVEEDGRDVLVFVNVGDSRAYRLQQGVLERITEDHSVVEELVRSGRLREDEASLHPQRHVLTRVLGVDRDVEVDCFRVLPYTGDRFLLASDGLLNEVDDGQIASVLRRVTDPEAAAQELVRLAKEHGGSDNITVVIVDVEDDGGRAAEASAAVESTGGRRTERVLLGSPGGTGRTGAPGGTRATAASPSPSARGTGGLAAPAHDAAPSRPHPVSETRDRRYTWRVLAFVLALVLVLAGAGATVAYFARSSYYVGLDADQVVIYQGRPGGLLWFEPTVAERTDLGRDEVPPARLPDVEAGKEAPSLADARRYVANLEEQAATYRSGPGSSTSTSALPPA